jgi:hypothetical protein
MAVTMKNGVFWMLRPVALVRTDVSEKPRASFIRVTRIGKLSRRPFYRSLGPRPLSAHLQTKLLSPPQPNVSHNSQYHSGFLSHLVFLRSLRRLLLAASVVLSLPILVTLMKEALGSSET